MSVDIKRNRKPQRTIVQDITMVSPDRNRKDIGALKAAIERAESIHAPNRSKLYDLYHDIITIDGHLSGILQKRTDAVKNKRLKFIDAKKQKVDDLDDLIKSEKFARLVEVIMERKYWGVSGVEFVVGAEFDFLEIPRKHIRPESNSIALSQYDYTGIPLTERPFVWVLANDYDCGRLLQCSMYALYKRSGFGDFAQYVEIFGQPVRIIYYDAYDTRTKAELKQILDNSGSSLAMMIPKQAEFKIMDGKTSNGDGGLQEKLIKLCNDEMSIAILGNSETTTSSSSSGYAQAKEHGKQQLEITKSDLEYVVNTLNNKFFIQILKSYGYAVEGGCFEYEQELNLESLKLRLEIDEKVSAKVPIDDDYWYTTYGIPKPKNYAALKAKAEEAETAEPEPEPIEPDSSPNKPKGKKEPTTREADSIVISKKQKNLIDRIGTFFFGGHELINLDELYASHTCPVCMGVVAERSRSAELPSLAYATGFDSIYDDIARKLLSAQLPTGNLDCGMYFETAGQLMGAVNLGMGGSTFDYDDSRNLMRTYLMRNIYQFSAAKTLTELEYFRNMMLTPKGDIRPFTEYRKLIAEAGYKFNANYLRTEYDTALQSSLMAVRWNKMQSEYLEFSTVGDNRVRQAHAILDGKTYPKNSAFWDKAYPPLAWNCRCTVIPGKATNYTSSEKEEIKDTQTATSMVKDTIFENNVGKTSLIFKDKHPYYHVDGRVKEEALDFKSYGMPTKDTQINKPGLKPIKQVESKTEFDALWHSMINHNKGIVFKDCLDNTILFEDYDLIKNSKSKYCFKQHIRDRDDEHKDRFKLLPNIKEMVETPDEIWSVHNVKNGKTDITTHYIKYYEKKMMLLEVLNSEADTIFVHESSGYSTRKGILLYRK